MGDLSPHRSGPQGIYMFFGKGMRVQVLALCITIAALLRSIWVLVDFPLLPIGETRIIPALSGEKTNPKGRKLKGFFF